MARQTSPTISIGLPVFNGESYLSAALESILAQTFDDFELIISDNASTDATPRICQEYAARDSRIRYYRNATNLGAAPNYNRTFALARGEYFKWVAHDDMLAPGYLQRCLTALEAHSDAVLCQSLVRMIDAGGEELGLYDSGLSATASPCRATRFASIVLNRHRSTEIFGLVRSKALSAVGPLGAYRSSDRVFLAALSLMGRFICVSEPLFINRDHPERYARSIPAVDWPTWHDTSLPRKVGFPSLRVYGQYWGAVRRNVAERRERWLCYCHLLLWWGVNWNLAHVVVEGITWVDPRAYTFAVSVKHRLLGRSELILSAERAAKQLEGESRRSSS